MTTSQQAETGIIETLSKASEQIYSNGPWAAAFFLTFVLLFLGVWWYVRNVDKRHQLQLEQLNKNHEKQVDVITTSSEKILNVTAKLNDEKNRIIDSLSNEMIIMNDKINKLNEIIQINCANVCALSKIDTRKDFLDDLSDKVNSTKQRR